MGFNLLTEQPASLCELNNIGNITIANNQLTSIPECLCNMPSNEGYFSYEWNDCYYWKDDIENGNIIDDCCP